MLKVNFTIIILALLCTSLSLAYGQDVQVTGFSDLSFGTYSGTGEVTASDGVCVYKSSGTSKYKVSPTGSGSGGSYELTTTGGTLAFKFEWRQSGGAWRNINANGSRNYNGANSSSTNCGGSDNAEYQIVIAANALDAANPGAYSGSVTVVIEPA